jgi:hypothetical protein
MNIRLSGIRYDAKLVHAVGGHAADLAQDINAVENAPLAMRTKRFLGGV